MKNAKELAKLIANAKISNATAEEMQEMGYKWNPASKAWKKEEG